jgi:hypothetical protein
VSKHSQKENDTRFYFVGHNDVGTIIVENRSYINQNTFGFRQYSYNTYLQVHYWICT